MHSTYGINGYPKFKSGKPSSEGEAASFGLNQSFAMKHSFMMVVAGF